ncbi:MAG TPA: 50S ribosomal protein L24 [Candidatus Limnocylindrales bacterium]|nr:50S ribosomal protein L24 [Candidatus Limnocylindrales bacterium]
MAGASVKLPEIRKGDTVVILSGKDAGKRGTVEKVVRNQVASALVQANKGSKGRVRQSSYWRKASPHPAAVVITGMNIAKRHQKPRQTQGRTDRMPKIQQGGIIDVPQPMSISKVMLVCPKCGQPTRIRHEVLDDGRRVRICTSCGQAMEASK